MACTQSEYALDMDVDNMCRICLSQTDASERLFHIFSSAIVDGFLVAIPDVLEFCVNLKVSISDGKPCKICQQCKGQLLGFYLFKQKCQRADTVLQQALGSSEKHCALVPAGANSPSDSEDNVMVEILENGTNYEDDTAGEEPDGTEEHVQEQTETQCHLCDQIFQTENDLKEYTASHCEIDSYHEDHVSLIEDEQIPEYEDEMDDKGTVMRNIDQEEEPIESEYPASTNQEDVCYLVGDVKIERRIPAESSNDQSERFSADIPDEEHDEDSVTTVVPESEEIDDAILPYAEESQVEQLSCNICRKIIKGRSRYFKHLQTHNVSTNVTSFLIYHICRVCSKVFLEESDYSEHLKATSHNIPADENPPTNNETEPYVCGICSEKYLRIDYVKQHLLSHLQSFACPFAGCGCEYTSVARLGLHISGKHVEYETHQCQHCGANTFESMAELQHHLRVKCKGKKFHCDHCDKKFLSSRSLAHHLKCLDKKHRCQECGKTFAQHGELKLHERIHNGERPFKCTVCGKTYKTASLRTAHMDSHIEGKTFQCQLCGKQLQTRTCYRNHIKRHSEERKHECDVCSKKFYTKYNVKVHKQKVHKLMQGPVKQENA